MAVIRVNKTADYSVISNFHFREKEMSLKAKGLLSLILSLPNDWNYSIAGLVTLSKDGKDSVMNALNELEQFGYLKRTRCVDEKGRFAGYDYDIYEKPQTEKQAVENPYSENPNTENPTQLNTNQLNTNELNNNKSSKKASKRNSFDEIINAYSTDEKTVDLLQEWLKVRKAKRAAMTDRAIQMNIDKLDSLAEESGMSVNEYLSEVICRGWAAFYPIKTYNNRQDGKTYGINGIAITDEKSDLDDLF